MIHSLARPLLDSVPAPSRPCCPIAGRSRPFPTSPASADRPSPSGRFELWRIEGGHLRHWAIPLRDLYQCAMRGGTLTEPGCAPVAGQYVRIAVLVQCTNLAGAFRVVPSSGGDLDDVVPDTGVEVGAGEHATPVVVDED